LSETLIDSVFDKIEQHKHRIKFDRVPALVNWRNPHNPAGYGDTSIARREPQMEITPAPAFNGGIREASPK